VARGAGWAVRRPHAAAALLRWGNLYRRSRTRVLLILLLGSMAAATLAEVPQTGRILDWLGRNVVVTFAAAACLFGLSAVRRRERLTAEAARSWLAATPVASPVGLEMIWGTAVRLVLISSFAALAWVLGKLDAHAMSRLALALVGGAVLGSLAGWRLPRAAGDSTPGYHYAIVRRARTRAASAPSLLPLGDWPAAQGRIFGRPKVLARVMLLTLVALPLGTPGQVALVIAAAAIAASSLAALSWASLRVAFPAARWLAPTTLVPRRFMAALIWRVLLRQTLFAAVMVFLACAIDLPQAVRLGIPLATGFLLVSLAAAAVACGWACRRAGLGAP
jgi:hypothetical protein